ncbi:hypothetical protein ERO13_D12G126950v2 [Gossypium hirsutum]|uniref:Uncharacterized protein n=1 Tax=Gossypium darwinii TaxID=34276 RepID=A0A5D2A8E6_GOSDA|nr:hypothetical protein ERO13_D12G126950v2 [Gossypium hirsutum]TYG41131.1 hypothetical protein ES288_D12G150500v1 [Gossypium darwinii]
MAYLTHSLRVIPYSTLTNSHGQQTYNHKGTLWIAMFDIEIDKLHDIQNKRIMPPYCMYVHHINGFHSFTSL